MTIALIPLDCPSCGSAMGGGRRDLLFVCRHCGAGAVLDAEALRPLSCTALLPVPGRHASTWRPAWLLDAAVSVDERIPADGRRTPGRKSRRSFVVPAFAMPLPHLTRLATALSQAAGATGEVPREPIRGGTMTLGDAATFVRHLVIGEEVRKPDMLASVEVVVDLVGHRLLAIPFETRGDQLVCAVTGVSVRETSSEY